MKTPFRFLPIAFGILCLLAVFPGKALATVPQQINYQGYLTDASGNPVPDADYDITFAIYDVPSGGTALWKESRIVSVSNGVYNVRLGTVKSFKPGLDFSGDLYLGITVDPDPEMTPRQFLTSVPFAMRAEDSDSLGGLGSSEYLAEGDTAKGDLSGVYPGPTVARIRGINVESTAPTSGQVLKYTGSSWAPGDDEAGEGDITQVKAGEGLSGGGDTGSVNLDVNTGNGITISSDQVSLNTAYTDSLYVNEGQANSVTSAMIVDNSVTSTDIQDGAGSGLDADTLDTLDSSDFARSGHNHDADYVNEGQADAVTAGMIVPNIVSSVDGVTNDGGNIDLVAGAHIAIMPNDTKDQILIAATGIITDHGDLSGLSDDDHPQYLTETEGEGLYVNVTGDTMTGNLAMTGNLTMTGSVSAGGNVKVTGIGGFKYEIPRTFYLGVPPAAFTPKELDYQNYINNGSKLWAGDEEQVYLTAPVQLPQGATVTEVEFYYLDNFTQGFLNLTGLLLRMAWAGTGTGDQMSSSTLSTDYSGADPNILSVGDSDSTIDYPVIDNSAYQYILWVYYNPQVTAPGSNDNLYFAGCRITYTLAELNP